MSSIFNPRPSTFIIQWLKKDTIRNVTELKKRDNAELYEFQGLRKLSKEVRLSSEHIIKLFKIRNITICSKRSVLSRFVFILMLIEMKFTKK